MVSLESTCPQKRGGTTAVFIRSAFPEIELFSSIPLVKAVVKYLLE